MKGMVLLKESDLRSRLSPQKLCLPDNFSETMINGTSKQKKNAFIKLAIGTIDLYLQNGWKPDKVYSHMLEFIKEIANIKPSEESGDKRSNEQSDKIVNDFLNRVIKNGDS